jgi:deoxyribose-phosphate aldolase
MEKIAKKIDQTFLKKDASEQEIEKVCQETKEYDFRGLCVFPEYTKKVKEQLKDTDIKTITLIDEPVGSSSHQQRINMVEKAKKDGSDEVDVVMKIDDFKNGKYQETLDDLKKISLIMPTKVIIGSGYLTDQEIEKASEIVKQAGAVSVKTATLKDPLDNSELEEKAKHIRIMKQTAQDLLIKASGAIRTFNDAEIMFQAGADIIGTSSGVEIVDQSMGKEIERQEDWRKKE